MNNQHIVTQNKDTLVFISAIKTIESDKNSGSVDLIALLNSNHEVLLGTFNSTDDSDYVLSQISEWLSEIDEAKRGWDKPSTHFNIPAANNVKHPI